VLAGVVASGDCPAAVMPPVKRKLAAITCRKVMERSFKKGA
jgi:hypothetical protein